MIFEQKRRTNQLCTAYGCTVIAPITALLFAKISNFDICPLDEVVYELSRVCYLLIKPFQDKFQNLVGALNASDEDSGGIQEQDIRDLCEELCFQAERMVLHHQQSQCRREKKGSQPRKQFVIVKIDDCIGFVVDAPTAQLMSTINTQFQVIDRFHFNYD